MAYGEEKQVYSNDARSLQEEPPLSSRLEEVLGVMRRCQHALDELENGPQLDSTNAIDRPSAGVLMLGMECEKMARSLENRVMLLVKRLGRL